MVWLVAKASSSVSLGDVPSMCRPDSGNSNLRSAAYEALMDLIKYSAKVVVSVLCVVSLCALCICGAHV